METGSRKYAGIVLRNTKNGVLTVQYAPVADALLSGGVILSELTLLPYESVECVLSALERVSKACDGVFFICDKVLTNLAKNAVERYTGRNFTSETLLSTENCLYAVISAGKRGAQTVREVVIPAVEDRRGLRYETVTVCCICAPAEVVLSAVSAAKELCDENVFIHTSEEFASQRIEVVYNQRAPKMITDEVVRILASELKGYVYALEDVTIAERLAKALFLHRYKIATAESFTGGGVASALIEIPGASKYFYEGINAYDNRSKQERLGVTEYTLQQKGAVSNETAYEMAAGLLKNGGCDIAVATTGIAGPASDSTEKPVGLCYIAVGTKERVRVFEYHLNGTREEITKTAINLALFLTYKEINHKLYD